MILLCRFRPGADAEPGFVARARRAVGLLSARPGCAEATVAQAVDEPGAWVLLARFESVRAYRAALSPFEVREHVVPLLAEALTDGSAVYEPRLRAVDGDVTEFTSVIAADAGTVGLGDAAGPSTPRS